jgi:pentose-5-phosphate-3-epimerase
VPFPEWVAEGLSVCAPEQDDIDAQVPFARPQVHLMVTPVDALIGEFAKAGASFITFHPEATGHVDRSLQLVRAAGCK